MMSNPKEVSENQEVPEIQTPVNFQYKNPGKSAFAQVLAVLIQNWLLIEIGLELAMPVIVLGSLYRNPAEPLNMDDDQASWFGSIPDFCHPIASLTSGFFQEKLGRKGSMILINVPIFAAWILLHFANSISILYVVSAIMGLCTGLAESPLHSYIGEIGEPHVRGTLSTISTSCCIIGVWIMFAFGYFFDWRTVALLSSGCSVISFTLMTQLPESPVWLVVQDRVDEARKSLCWLRGWVGPEEVEEELQALVKHTQNSAKQEAEDSVSATEDRPLVRKRGYLKTQCSVLMTKKVLLPLRMVLLTFIFTFFAYVSGMRPYLIGELSDLGSPVDPKLILIYSQGLFFVGAVVNVAFLRRFGKRKIALFSYAVVAVCIFGLGIYGEYLKGSTQFPELNWLPVILWLVINFFSGFSIMILPWQLVCEVFPPVGRGLSTGISAALAHLIMSAMSKSYLYLENWLDFSGVMYFYGAMTVLGFVYLYFFLFETEGKSLSQIESYFTENHDKTGKFSKGKSEGRRN